MLLPTLFCAVRGGKPGKNVDLIESDLKALCRKVREVLLSQPMLLELEAPIQILGDTHGQFYDTLRLFEYGGFPPESNYLFLGDYVDRGRHSLENVCLLFCYKVKYPENFFLLRGNHESASINRVYGFYDECKRRFNIKMFKTFEDVFNCLPVAALVSDKIFCMHGAHRQISLPIPGRPKDKFHSSVIDRHKRARPVPKNFLFTDEEELLRQNRQQLRVQSF
ncbi:hypothetical protein HPB51_007796 [Rhipicephalus microplus]|uniref:Serine/threonine-protein phosphatase n=1 Tax=Rhipicephalus microplus TaxID=6941 RepID=A0A9J6EZK8_RHIMP|nr:hypothetical protein HPB51_007796 [Rhipicephalus microplus]